MLWLIKGLGPGGAERLLVSAATAADPHQVHYEAAYLLAAKHQLVPELEAAGIAVHPLGVRSVADARWLLRLRRLLRSNRYDIVHVHSPLVAAVARPALPWLAGPTRPLLAYTEHNDWSGYSPLTRWANRLTYSLDDVQVAVSEGTRASVPPPRRRRLQVIVHGIPLRQVEGAVAHRDATRTYLGIEPDEVLVGTVANHRKEKDYATLLTAARRVVDSGQRVRFVAVGQGPLTAAIQQDIRRLGLTDSFRLLGYRSDPVEMMAGFDVFVLSSHREGYPVALMEALALGLPVVATAVGGSAEAIRTGVEGFLVPPGDPAALADAIIRLIDPEQRATMAEAARRRAPDHDIAVALARIESRYREALAACEGWPL